MDQAFETGEFPKGILSRQNPNLLQQPENQKFPTPQEILTAFFEKDDKGESDYNRAMGRPNHKEFTRDQLLDIATRSLNEMSKLESAARSPDRWNIPEEVTQKIKRIIVFSAPGTYIQPVKKDRMQHKTWAWAMDRIRADEAARLGIIAAGLATGHDFSKFGEDGTLNANDSELASLRESVKEAIIKSGIRFVYAGRSDEVDAIRRALKHKDSFIPSESVDIIEARKEEGEKYNTLRQVEDTGSYLRENTDLKPDDSIVFVAHGPQLVRMAGMFEKSGAIPSHLLTYFFPNPIPTLGLHQYPLEEVKGRLYYTITGDSVPESCRYSILMGKD